MLHIFIAAPAVESRPGSCGRPVPGYEARIVNDDMETLPPGSVGRLAVRGPTGCRYLDDPRQSTYVRDGWNLTGDAFSMDADGYFWFQARTDDMIISSGYNISGFEVEAALLEHPLVTECAVVAAPDDERGHVVKAYVVVVRARRRPRAAGPRQGPDRALQVPARRRVRRRPAAHTHRQGPAQRPPRVRLMRRLQPPGWPEPRGYANGIAATGELIFVGGQIGWDETGAFPHADLAGQVGQALRNILAVLAEADAGPEHIARLTWYVTSRTEYLDNLKAIGAAYRAVMGRNYPAMAVVEVTAPRRVRRTRRNRSHSRPPNLNPT